jgi:hypothetical protein
VSLPEPLGALDGPDRPGIAAAEARLRALGLEPIAWSNGPGDRYGAHEHAFVKLLVCADGSITFLVGDDERPAALGAGMGFVLPARTRHAAVVGPQGCTCLEGHRP